MRAKGFFEFGIEKRNPYSAAVESTSTSLGVYPKVVPVLVVGSLLKAARFYANICEIANRPGQVATDQKIVVATVVKIDVWPDLDASVGVSE
jgi:hypothetical protein